ncbi:MAG: PTS sugar transporter subunit IIA [Thiohalocapsa sp.]
MLPPDLITEARILSGCEVTSKKRLLESLGELLAEAGTDLNPDTVFERLLERERLGSTGLGHGIALPHARIDEVMAPVGAFVQLRAGVAFDAIDDQPVDLAFALLVPREADERHLQLLAGLAEMFNEPLLRQRLRDARSSADLLEALGGWGLHEAEQ